MGRKFYETTVLVWLDVYGQVSFKNELLVLLAMVFKYKWKVHVEYVFYFFILSKSRSRLCIWKNTEHQQKLRTCTWKCFQKRKKQTPLRSSHWIYPSPSDSHQDYIFRLGDPCKLWTFTFYWHPGREIDPKHSVLSPLRILAAPQATTCRPTATKYAWRHCEAHTLVVNPRWSPNQCRSRMSMEVSN